MASANSIDLTGLLIVCSSIPSTLGDLNATLKKPYPTENVLLYKNLAATFNLTENRGAAAKVSPVGGVENQCSTPPFCYRSAITGWPESCGVICGAPGFRPRKKGCKEVPACMGVDGRLVPVDSWTSCDATCFSHGKLIDGIYHYIGKQKMQMRCDCMPKAGSRCCPGESRVRERSCSIAIPKCIYIFSAIVIALLVVIALILFICKSAYDRRRRLIARMHVCCPTRAIEQAVAAGAEEDERRNLNEGEQNED